MARKIFKEKQRVKDPLLLGAFIALLIYSLFLFGRELVINGFANATPIILLACAILVIAVGLWILVRLQLNVTVTRKGINFKMSPLHNKKKRLRWDEIEEVEVIETPKMADMHGGNMKFWYEKKFTLSGRNGISVITKDGERFFIGTRETADLKKSIQKALNKRKKRKKKEMEKRNKTSSQS